jgi:hypothetical protein
LREGNVRPELPLNRPAGKTVEIWFGVVRGRDLEFRQELTAPDAQKRKIQTNVCAGLKVIRVQNVVVIHKNQEFSLDRLNPTETGRRQPEHLFSNVFTMWMPGQVNLPGQQLGRSVVHKHEFPI